MHQLTKITLSKFLCTPSKITLDKPSLTTASPICPFDFYVESNSFRGPIPEVHHLSTVWEMATDINFDNVIATVETVDDKEMVLFPSKLIKEGTTYYLRAYFVTDYGDTEWSDVITVTTNLIDIIPTNIENITNCSMDYDTDKILITEVNGVTVRIVYNYYVPEGHSSSFEIDEWNGEEWISKARFIEPWPMSTDPNYAESGTDWLNEWNYPRTCSFAHCTSTKELYFTATFMTGDTLPRSLMGIYLFKYDAVDKTITVLSNDNTGLFNRDGMCLFYYDDEIFMQGGYRFDTDGSLITPDDTERTLIKFNLTTNQFSEVALTSTLKPRNYRYSCTCTRGDKSYIFGGHGKVASTQSPEFWCFDHSKSKWIAMPMYPIPDHLTYRISAIEVNPFNSLLHLVAIDNNGSNSLGLQFEGILVEFDMEEGYWLMEQPLNYRINDDEAKFIPVHASLKNEHIYISFIDDGGAQYN